MRDARHGNLIALGWLLKQEHDWLALHAELATNFGSSICTAHDLVQDCVLAVLTTSHHTTARSRAQFRSWLKTIVRNQVLNELRRARPQFFTQGKEEELSEKSNDPEVEFVLEWMKLPRTAIGFEFESVIVLRDFCGCSFNSIASLLRHEGKRDSYKVRSKALDAMRLQCSS
ncbi:MAG: DNA-directed RNA polymerase specialized sigma24 family protein [Planctomycetota bacterium]